MDMIASAAPAAASVEATAWEMAELVGLLGHIYSNGVVLLLGGLKSLWSVSSSPDVV